MSKFLSNIKIHKSWVNFFNREDVKAELKKIESLIGNDFTPHVDNVLRFATIDLMKVLIIWLGKDVYPQGVATGRSFEVSGVTDWADSEVNSSLKNIIKLINKAYLNKEFSSGIEEVRSEIENGIFKIPSPDKAFDYWESQGVLFLNSAFTCRLGDFSDTGSHLAIWSKFFNMLIEYIATENPNIKYFLWGNSRKYDEVLKKLNIKEDNLYLSYHPCTNGDKGGYKHNSKFLNCPCFKDTMDLVDWIEK